MELSYPPGVIREFTSEHLDRLNSATGYPSIPTYHVIGERGRLTEDRAVDFSAVDPADVRVTEKIDGTNARIIVLPKGMGGAVIGSRGELLHYLGDVIANPAQGIVGAVLDVARRAARMAPGQDDLVVIYGEVYGGTIGRGSGNYSAVGAVGFRIFDVAIIPVDVLARESQRIASWRDSGGQRFLRADMLGSISRRCGVDLVPPLSLGAPPASVRDTHGWLNGVTGTLASLDVGGKGRAEGVVVRTSDRSLIAKIRAEDYARTLGAEARNR
ncbi:MAG: RNA ligase family protein [Pseudonocardiaceae bacterium]